MEQILEKYAQLVVRTGVNLQPDQLLVINAPIECAAFARKIAGAAYAAGAHDVIVSWNDEKTARIRYDMAPIAVFGEFPEWRKQLYVGYAQQGAAFVSIHAADPEIFSGVNPERLAAAQQAAGEALKEYRERMMTNKNSWCVVSIPTEAWARKVFPGVDPELAVEKLWQEILAAIRVNASSNPVENWDLHLAYLEKARTFLNRQRFTRLHFKNGRGTDLQVELPEGHIWASGAEYTEDNIRFVANMPTEEVYTLPKFDGVNGRVVGTKPFAYQGSLIENFVLDFEKGKVVNYRAEKGQEVLENLILTDAGSCRLGEVALVPVDSPISRSGILFYNTLFDENASCHLAFGKAYPTCLKNGENMTPAEREAAGINESLLHEDFMIGSEDMSVTGITADGKEIPVFREGNFVDFD
ncbi:MAG: aminopeptidase [Selenomonadaceae bacterium]